MRARRFGKSKRGRQDKRKGASEKAKRKRAAGQAKRGFGITEAYGRKGRDSAKAKPTGARGGGIT